MSTSSYVISKARRDPRSAPKWGCRKPQAYVAAVGKVILIARGGANKTITKVQVEMVAPQHQDEAYDMRGKVLKMTMEELGRYFDVFHVGHMGGTAKAMGPHITTSNKRMAEIYRGFDHDSSSRNAAEKAVVTDDDVDGQRGWRVNDYVCLTKKFVVYGAALAQTRRGGAAPECPEMWLASNTIVRITDISNTQHQARGTEVWYEVTSPLSVVETVSLFVDGAPQGYTTTAKLDAGATLIESDRELQDRVHQHLRDDADTGDQSQIFDKRGEEEVNANDHGDGGVDVNRVDLGGDGEIPSQVAHRGMAAKRIGTNLSFYYSLEKP